MALGEQKDVTNPEKRTGFTFNGREIVLAKTRGAPPTGKEKPGFYSDKKKVEALTIFAVTGNIAEVERLTGVTRHIFKKWQKEEWFHEALEDLRNENDHQFDAAFTDIIEKLIGAINDRVANGDHVVLRDGTIIRKPVSLRDVIGAMMITIDKRQLLRGKPTSRSESVSVENRLEKLVMHFESLAKKGRPTIKPASGDALTGLGAPDPVLLEGTYVEGK